MISRTTANVLAIILGGGRGQRLFPLTRDRAKPAVPLAGKYRLVDIPLSNCINSGLNSIYLLTQFNSASLHRHISQSFKFDHFSGGFVEILAAEQTLQNTSWYEGTADAVRKNLLHFSNLNFQDALILSGDQLYRMDFRTILREHQETNADITIATKPVDRKSAPSLGIMETSQDRRIVRFVEKPSDASSLDSLKMSPETCRELAIEDPQEAYLASMGIYVFKRDMLFQLMDRPQADFGKDIIPRVINTCRVFASVFQGYWEDIGTIQAYFRANLDLTSELPRFNFFDMNAPIFTHPRFLPASKINGAQIDHAVLSDGCILNRCHVTHSIIGVRSLVEEDSHLTRTVLIGSDHYEKPDNTQQRKHEGIPPIGIGRHTRIENAIIDVNARIGSHCIISPKGKPENLDCEEEDYYIRDGIIIIPKNGIVPDDRVL